jgi:hypothetical protein
MTAHELGMAQACAVRISIACLALLLPSASLLHARGNDAVPSKTILLAPRTEAHIQPLIVMSSLANIAAAPQTGTSTEPAAIPEVTGQEQTINQSDGAAAETVPTDNAPIMTQAPPAPGQLFGTDDPDRLFGIRGGFVHPSLLFREEWTDNLYNINQDQQSNFLTVVTPGIWFGFPRMEEAPLSLSLNNGAIGGHHFLVADSKSFDRFQAYLAGTLDYKLYSANADLNDTSWQLAGFARYNMPAGLSLHVLDTFSADRDRFDRGTFASQQSPTPQQDPALTASPSFIRDYISNLVNTGLEYTMTDRYTVNFSYTNFSLIYDDDDAWLNRSDNSFTLSLSYHFSPKTSFITEYSHALVSYEEQDANDSTNTFLYGGLNWKGSSRISLAAKVGYQEKEFSTGDEADSGAFSMEGVFDYLISDKTKISFSTYKALEETNTLGSRGMDTIAAKMRYEQRFAYRLGGGCELLYEQNDHDGFVGTDQTGDPRRDTTFAVRPSVDYLFRDWLTAELAYTYENRNSNDNQYDFSTQTIILGLNFAL